MTRAAWLAAALVTAGCAAPAPPPAAAGPAAGSSRSPGATRGVTPPPAEPDTPPRWLRPVPVPAWYRAALSRRTRSASGAPGPRYWQQAVSYRIEARLDPATARVTGSERIVYRNRSPRALGRILLNLYPNLYAPGSPRNRAVVPTGGVALERVAAQGVRLDSVPAWHLEGVVRPAPGDDTPAGWLVDATLAWIVLPHPVPPGDSAVLEVAWHHTVPRAPGFRTVWSDGAAGRVFQVAQWYPQVAVLDDLNGWDATPYLGDGEFYLEYGDFDVAVTLPAGWIVGATGTLANPGEVLSPQTRERLARAAGADAPVRVVDAADLAAGRATLRPPGGSLTWRFRASGVRDFAFSASDRYLWDAATATLPAADGRPARRVAVHALHRAGVAGWDDGAPLARRALEFYAAALVPYPWPQLTVAEGPLSGGMEYPQLVFAGGFDPDRGLFALLAHEIAHQWFPMLVGADEGAWAWMDEGLATWMQAQARADFAPGGDAWGFDRRYYAAVAGGDLEVPLMRHTDLVSPYGVRYVAAYSKPALLLRALQGVVGDSVLRAALRVYAREWSFRHPTPWDFFATVQRVSGRELGWFFSPGWFDTVTLDQAVDSVEALSGGRVRVTVRDRGGIPAPAWVRVTDARGDTARAEVPVDAWLAGRRTAQVTVRLGAPPTRVEIDPAQWLPDARRADNVWPPPPP